MRIKKTKILFTIVLLALTNLCLAQKKNISGIYFNTFTDYIGHNNCCRLIEFLKLNKDKTFTYYQKNHQGDYFEEGYSNGKYKVIGDSILFTSTLQTDTKSRFENNFIEYSGFKMKILKSCLETLRPIGIVAGGKSEVEKYYKTDFKNFDSLKVSIDRSDDSTQYQQYLVIMNDGSINYSFSSRNRKTKKTKNEQKELKLNPKKFKLFLNKLSENLILETMKNNIRDDNYDIYLYLKDKKFINGGRYFSEKLYNFLFKETIDK